MTINGIIVICLLLALLGAIIGYANAAITTIIVFVIYGIYVWYYIHSK